METQAQDAQALSASDSDPQSLEMVPTGVLVVGESQLWISGLRQVLQEATDFCLAGSGKPTEAIDPLLAAVRPAQVVMEMGRAHLLQGDTVRAVKAYDPSIQVVVITGEASVPAVTRLVHSGADGILGADIMPASLIAVLRLLRDGAQFVTSHELWPAVRESIRGEPVEDDARVSALTPRERDVYDLLRQGRSDREIAEILTLSLWTVKHHVVNVLQKLELHSRRELLRSGSARS